MHQYTRNSPFNWRLLPLIALSTLCLTSCRPTSDHIEDSSPLSPHLGMKSRVGPINKTNESVVRILQEGRKTNSREIGFVVDSLRRYKNSETSNLSLDEREILKRQAQTLFSDRLKDPQGFNFEISFDTEKDLYRIKGIDPAPKLIVNTIQSDIVVIGGELSAFTTALKAARKGSSVTIVFSGEAGGVISDTGANLRTYDRVPKMEYTPEQETLFKEMGVNNKVAIPRGVSAAIESYFENNWSKNVHLVRVPSTASLRVEQTEKVITGITTPEGIRIVGKVFMDATPDAILAEKFGVSIDYRAPQLACGVVFDLDNIDENDLRVLGSPNPITPDRICRALGINLDKALEDPTTLRAFEAYNKQTRRTSQVNSAWALGFCPFADAFQFYMCVKALLNPSPELALLNRDRVMTGFNVVLSNGGANFNSISYKLPYQKPQDSSQLEGDPDTWAILKFDIPGMQEFARLVLDKQSVTIRPPKTLYVRKSLGLLREENVESVLSTKQFRWNDGEPINTGEMSYQIDLRGAFERDPFDPRDPEIERLIPSATKRSRKWSSVIWPVNSKNAHVRGSNLWVIGKTLPPQFAVGGTRINAYHVRLGSQIIRDLYLAGELPISLSKR